MTEDNSTPPAATPATNQNLIIGLVLGAVVLLLFLLVVQMTGGKSNQAASEVAQLKAERDALVAKRTDPSAPATGALSPQALATRLSNDSNTLAGLVSQMQTMLAQREDELKSTRSLYQHTSRELESARQQLANVSANASQVESLTRQLTDTQALLTQAENLAAQLRQQLAGAPSESVLAKLRADFDQALTQRDAAQRELAELKELTKDQVPSDQFAALTRELQSLKEKSGNLETENNKLNYDLQKLQAELDRTRLFVEADALPAKAKLLYDELAKLETATVPELKTKYEQIGQTLGARVLDTISFQTGSSVIPLDKVEEISRTTQASSDQSFFLVVGYASKSGDLTTNRKLSAERATRIASVTNLHKKTGQGVQAVFLSETHRFHPDDLAKNQICEIWEITK